MTFEESFLATPWAFLDWVMMHLGDLGICGMAVAAFLALSEYKKRVRFEHEFDAAKRTLHAFYELRDALQRIRRPFHPAWELNELQNRPETNDFETRIKENPEVGVTLLRMDKHQKYISAVMGLKPEFRAFFGDDISPFKGAIITWNEVDLAARSLTRPSELDKMQKAKYREVIYWSGGENDLVTKKMDEIVQKIEDICLPVLRGDKRP